MTSLEQLLLLAHAVARVVQIVAVAAVLFVLIFGVLPQAWDEEPAPDQKVRVRIPSGALSLTCKDIPGAVNGRHLWSGSTATSTRPSRSRSVV